MKSKKLFILKILKHNLNYGNILLISENHHMLSLDIKCKLNLNSLIIIIKIFFFF